MTVPNREHERRDWTLIIFLIPLGIILIIIVGQLAIRIFPNWVINADMRSNLDPNSAPGQPASLLQPLLPQILTPMAWAESYLTPGAGGDVSFPPFIVLEPTDTPTATPVSPTPTTPSPTATTPSPTPTSTVIFTPTPTEDDEEEPPAICQNPSATNFGAPLPCIFSTPTPSPTSTGYPSTLDSSLSLTSIPAELEINSTPNSTIGMITDGQYVVINLSVVVEPTPDENYDLVYYEYKNGNYVFLDWIIIGISHDPSGSVYYEVFNWGNDNSPDTNSNVDTNVITPDPNCTSLDLEYPECDNHQIELDDLHDPDGDADLDTSNRTGILIDVDNAPSSPPPDTYNYIVIISPYGGSANEPVEIDAIDVTEVPTPTP